jgi:hypothetical protein
MSRWAGQPLIGKEPNGCKRRGYTAYGRSGTPVNDSCLHLGRDVFIVWSVASLVGVAEHDRSGLGRFLWDRRQAL